MVKFAIYTFLGFIMESIYVSLLQRKIVFSGLLKGPFIPIYGFGALIILSIAPICTNNFDIFFYSLVLCTFIEYVTHFFLYYDTHIKIWDYHCFKEEYAGRICLFYSLMWGVLGILLINIIDPLITYGLSFFHPLFLNILSFVYFFIILYQFYNHQYQKKDQ